MASNSGEPQPRSDPDPDHNRPGTGERIYRNDSTYSQVRDAAWVNFKTIELSVICGRAKLVTTTQETVVFVRSMYAHGITLRQ
jgi:hypothetical protein